MILYFKPEGSDWKLPEHLTTTRDVQGGPGGNDGTIYSDGSGKIGFYPDAQEWVESDGVWLGIDRDSIDSAGLERDELIDGYYVTLEDGNKWLIPVARVFPSGTKLPESLILGPNGELISEILPQFAQFSKDADRAFSALVGDEDLSMADAWEIAVKALSINYKIDRQEVSLLRLLTTTNVMEILKATVDFPAVLEMFKKKAKDDISSSVGNED